MEKQLRQVFEDVSDWLKFAERKNATLLGGNLAGVYGISSLLLSGSDIHSWVYTVGWVIITLLGVSSLVCLLSFLPKVEIPPLARFGSTGSADNLLLYTDIASYEPDDYLEQFAQWNDASAKTYGRLEHCYANQIVANARIATAKFRHFSVAMWLSFVAFITPIVSVAIYYISK